MDSMDIDTLECVNEFLQDRKRLMFIRPDIEFMEYSELSYHLLDIPKHCVTNMFAEYEEVDISGFRNVRILDINEVFLSGILPVSLVKLTITDTKIPCLEHLVNLQKLRIDSLDTLSQLPNGLKELELNNVDIGCSLPDSLVTLKICHCKSKKIIDFPPCMDSLKVLNSRIKLGNLPTSLRILHLSKNGITNLILPRNLIELYIYELNFLDTLELNEGLDTLTIMHCPMIYSRMLPLFEANTPKKFILL